MRVRMPCWFPTPSMEVEVGQFYFCDGCSPLELLNHRRLYGAHARKTPERPASCSCTMIEQVSRCAWVETNGPASKLNSGTGETSAASAPLSAGSAPIGGFG